MWRFSTIIFILGVYQCLAQIETDRPDFTESPNVVPKGALQVETGFILENDKSTFRTLGVREDRNLTLNTTLLRFGLTESVEIRFNWNVQQQKIIFINHPLIDFPPDILDPRRGFNTSFIGFKTNLYKSEKVSIGFLGHLYIPELTSGDFTAPEDVKVAPEFLIPLTYKLAEKFNISVQYGLTWNGLTPNPTTSYTLALGYGITEKLKVYIEPYGFLTNNGDELHLINGGFTYLINNDIQIDLTGGLGLNEIAPDNFISCGASFLLFNK